MRTILTTILILTGAFTSSWAQNFNLDFRGEISYPYSCASIWGYVDNDGTEYALVGTYAGVSIVDVSDPDNPEIKFDVPHSQNLWREIKTYGHYAYATNEVGGGLLVIDLGSLPASVQSSTFTYTDASGSSQENGHTLWIDENGKLFIFGGGYGNGGATIFDLAADPLNPPYLGKYEQHYIHDGFVRGDTLWASEIYDGKLELVNVSNPASPVPLASVSTPSFFTHNAWPTHDNKYVFTTDEVDNSYLTSYDVSDLSNITELDRVQCYPGSGSIVHNVHLYNDQFAWTAYYKDGVVLFDVSQPDNMIKVASYDTDPQESGPGYGGTWGVYPYLPSGNIIVSDLYTSTTNGKLTILTPNYIAASWLQGNVTDAITSTPVNNALVEILTTLENDNTSLSGLYKTGTGISGSYTVKVSKAGYAAKEIQNVSLVSGVTTILDVALTPLVAITIKGNVSDSLTNELLDGAGVYLHSLNVGLSYDLTTDNNGDFVVTPIFEDEYDVFVGKWGYYEKAYLDTVLYESNATVNFKISKGYYDDFIFDNSWMVSGNASTGSWELGEPIGTIAGSTMYNPENDVTDDFGDACFVTGNAGGEAGFDDVDNGSTTLTSPVMDLSGYSNPVISFYSWFANGEGSGTPNDTLKVSISDGTTTVSIANIKNPMSQWVYHEYPVTNYLTPNSTIKVSFSTADQENTGHIVEAAIDKFEVKNVLTTGIAGDPQLLNCCSASPNPFVSENTIRFNFGTRSFTTASLNVYSILGELVEKQSIHSYSGTLGWGSSLSDGIYLVKVMVDGQTRSILKVVKTK
ncbi:MAG: choice-of-anchor B family protein [Chitinophagales bacterium]